MYIHVCVCLCVFSISQGKERATDFLQFGTMVPQTWETLALVLFAALGTGQGLENKAHCSLAKWSPSETPSHGLAFSGEHTDSVKNF